jgi:hypothetical protein
MARIRAEEVKQRREVRAYGFTCGIGGAARDWLDLHFAEKSPLRPAGELRP